MARKALSSAPERRRMQYRCTDAVPGALSGHLNLCRSSVSRGRRAHNLLVALTERCHDREGFAADVARELGDGHGHGLPGRRWATCAPPHGQYLSGGGDENCAVYFCSTSWLPHLGHTAFASCSSMWHVTANFRLHFLHLNS